MDAAAPGVESVACTILEHLRQKLSDAEIDYESFDGVHKFLIRHDGLLLTTVAAVGLDDTGEKHLLGLVRGSIENAGVVKDLLQSLVRRGIDASAQRLFVIDGSKAIRSAIEQVYGEQGLVQRCRAHKVRNVTERLPSPRARRPRA